MQFFSTTVFTTVQFLLSCGVIALKHIIISILSYGQKIIIQGVWKIKGFFSFSFISKHFSEFWGSGWVDMGGSLTCQ
jgi:hypothetical protein